MSTGTGKPASGRNRSAKGLSTWSAVWTYPEYVEHGVKVKSHRHRTPVEWVWLALPTALLLAPLGVTLRFIAPGWDEGMGVNKTVFPSKGERASFEHLKSRWGDRYKIYPNLPFLTVFNTEDLFDISNWSDLRPITVSKDDFARLKKTSIDYTLCAPDDTPLICIEFDGIQHGWNQGSEYVTAAESGEWRKQILSLKLKVARSSLFPCFVLGSSHFREMDTRDRLAMVDCIIGSVIAAKSVRERINRGVTPEDLGMSDEDFAKLGDLERQETIQDWLDAMELDAEVENNPLYEAIFRLNKELGVTGCEWRFIDHPLMEGVSDPAKRPIYWIAYPMLAQKLGGSARRASCNGKSLGSELQHPWVHAFQLFDGTRRICSLATCSTATETKT